MSKKFIPGPSQALDGKGHRLPYSSDQVREIVASAVDDPDAELLVAIFKKGEDLMVQVWGEPSKEILDCLEQTARAYRSAVET